MRPSTLIAAQLAYVVALALVSSMLLLRRNYGRRALRMVSRSPFPRPRALRVRPIRRHGEQRADAEGTVSYSLYGNYARYAPTLRRSLRRIARLLPEFQPRVYVASDAPDDVCQDLASDGAHVVVMGPHVPMGHEGATWRFLAAAEARPFVCADADDVFSATTAREVRRWLSSGERFLSLQYVRMFIPLDAGKWGARDAAVPDMQERLDSYAETWFGFDEAFLAVEVWPLARAAGCRQVAPNVLEPAAVAAWAFAIASAVAVFAYTVSWENAACRRFRSR